MASRARMPSFDGVTHLLQKNPEHVWLDDQDREYGLLDRSPDPLNPGDEEWWIRLSRWTADPDLTASAPRNDEAMVYPRKGDRLQLTNAKTGEVLFATVLRYPERTESGQRLAPIFLNNIS